MREEYNDETEIIEEELEDEGGQSGLGLPNLSFNKETNFNNVKSHANATIENPSNNTNKNSVGKKKLKHKAAEVVKKAAGNAAKQVLAAIRKAILSHPVVTIICILILAVLVGALIVAQKLDITIGATEDITEWLQEGVESLE